MLPGRKRACLGLTKTPTRMRTPLTTPASPWWRRTFDLPLNSCAPTRAPPERPHGRLGVSSHQFDTPERGFSLRHDGPLDMRMNTASGEPASAWLARVEVGELTQVLRRYGEVTRPDRLAHRIVEARETQPLATTHDLIRVLSPTAPPGKENKHNARSFPAIRIHHNHEVGALEDLLKNATACLPPREAGRHELPQPGRPFGETLHAVWQLRDDVKRDMKGRCLRPSSRSCARPLWRPTRNGVNPAPGARLRVAERTEWMP